MDSEMGIVPCGENCCRDVEDVKRDLRLAQVKLKHAVERLEDVTETNSLFTAFLRCPTPLLEATLRRRLKALHLPGDRMSIVMAGFEDAVASMYEDLARGGA